VRLPLVGRSPVTPNVAAHDPDQHDAQRLAVEATLIDGDLAAPIQQSASFQCKNGMAGPYPCKNVDLEGFVSLPELDGATDNDVWAGPTRRPGASTRS
jgi:hypothetical protein